MTVTPTRIGPHLSAEALADALRGLPAWPWPGETGSLSPVGGGLNNLNWMLTRPNGERWFVKVPGVGTDAYVDRDLCHEASTTAANAGIAPQVVYYDRESGIEVSAFLDGFRQLTEDEVAHTDITFTLMTMYRHLHAQPPLAVTRTLPDEIRSALTQVRDTGIALPGWVQSVIEAWWDVDAALREGGLETVPCHNDPNFTNMMVNAAGELRLVDYEFAANSDPIFEVGSLLGFYDIPDSKRHDLIAAYYGEYEYRHDARMRLGFIAMMVRFGLWAIQKAYDSDPDYDYFKYGSVYFMEVEEQMRDPRFPSWLAAAALPSSTRQERGGVS